MAKPARTRSWELPERIRSQSTRTKPATRTTKPTLKPHFPKVVAYVYMSRYATVDHVRYRFPDTFTSDRTCRRHLAELVDLGLLTTVDVRSTGANWPNVYICAGKGVAYLRRHFNWELPDAREEAVTIPSVTHELFLTEFELACWETVRTRADLKLHFQERRYFHATKQLRFPAQQGGKNRRLIPDAGFVLAADRKPGNPPGLLLFFAEFDNGTEHPDVVLHKFETYAAWWASEPGQHYLLDLYSRYGAPTPKPNFRLLVIARRQGDPGQDERRLVDLFTQALQLPEPTQARMWFTTVDAIRAHQHDDPPLTAPMWLKVADAAAWLPAFRALTSTLDATTKPAVHMRSFVAERIDALPKHALFPPPLK